jgi:hypothetical protein
VIAAYSQKDFLVRIRPLQCGPTPLIWGSGGVVVVLTNFEHLRADRPELATAYAEQYAYADPASALVKLRTFGEQLTKSIHWELRLPKSEFARMLTAPEFRAASRGNRQQAARRPQGGQQGRAWQACRNEDSPVADPGSLRNRRVVLRSLPWQAGRIGSEVQECAGHPPARGQQS